MIQIAIICDKSRWSAIIQRVGVWLGKQLDCPEYPYHAAFYDDQTDTYYDMHVRFRKAPPGSWKNKTKYFFTPPVEVTRDELEWHVGKHLYGVLDVLLYIPAKWFRPRNHLGVRIMEKRFAKVIDGVVQTICVAEKSEDAPGYVELNEASDSEIGIGDLYDGVVFSKVPPLPLTVEQKRQKIERQRDITLAAGLTWNGNKYHIDQTMIAALNGRLTLWQEGKIAADAKLPIRRMDNAIELLDRAQHADLADALRLHGEAVYAASWVEKDALDKPLKEIKP